MPTSKEQKKAPQEEKIWVDSEEVGKYPFPTIEQINESERVYNLKKLKK